MKFVLKSFFIVYIKYIISRYLISYLNLSIFRLISVNPNLTNPKLVGYINRLKISRSTLFNPIINISIKFTRYISMLFR